MPQEAEARAAYERACTHDRRGEEAAAIPEYERSLALGLPRDERCQALLGLGSSLRNVGRYDEAVKVLRAAVAEFPDHAALRAFLALALHSRGEGREAMVALLDLTLRYAPLGSYARALGEYRDRLNHAVDPEDGWPALALSLTRVEFSRSFPFPFLLEIGGMRALAEDFDDVTEVGRNVASVEEPPPRGATPLVLPVRKVGNAVPSAITVGRTPSSDVSIRDGFVSKIHAFFRVADGRCELSDAGSRNGTWVCNKRLDGNGEPQLVRSGDTVVFGRAAFYFLDAGGCWDRLRKR